MSNVFATAGTILRVAADSPGTYDDDAVTGFPSLTYTEVGEVTDFGEFGGTAEIITHIPVKENFVVKRKGAKNYGAMSIQLGRDATDAGQILLQAGFDGAQEFTVHSVEMETPDGNFLYFTGMVSSFTYNAGSANQIFGGSVAFELDNKPLPVAGD